MIDIILITHNRLAFTKQVVEHLLDRTKTPFQLIVVDNASQDGTQDYINYMMGKHPGLIKRFIPSKINVGLQAAKNLALPYVESALFVDTDNDCLCPQLEPDWLQQQIDLMQKYPEYAAISLRPQILIGVGPIFKDAKEVVENNVAGGSLRMMRLEVVLQVGGWIDQFENRREEWEICGKLRNAGYKVGYARDLFTYHMFGDGNWGYGKYPHGHTSQISYLAKDEPYNPVTMIPKEKHNE